MSWLGASIVRRLTVVTLAVGLLTGTIGVVVVHTLERRELVEEAANRNLALADRTATRIDDRLARIRAQLALLAAGPVVAALEPDASVELEVALRVSGELDELLLYDRAGRAVAAAASSALLRPEGLPPRAELDDPGREGQVQLLDGDDLPSFEIAMPVEDPPGTFVGVLVGQAPLALVTQELTARSVRAAGTAFLTATDGTILDHRELDRVLEGEVFPVDEVFADERRASVAVDDEQLIVTASRLQSLPGWVIVEQPEREVLQPARMAVGGITGVFLAVVAATVVTVILAGKRLLAPLRPLAVGVERLGQGDLEIRVAPVGTGELGVLGRGFNQMAASLQERQHGLERAEQAARDSEERLRLMVEGVEDYAIVLLDLDGVVRSWNTGARRLLGYQTHQAVGRPLARFLELGTPSPDPLERASSTGRAEVDGWCHRYDGNRFWARTTITALQAEDRAPYGFAVIVHDLTERLTAQVAMEEALDRERKAAAELRRASELKDEFLAIATHEIRTPLSAILGASQVLSQDWERLNDDERRRFHAMIETYADDMRGIVERLLDFTRLQAGRVRLVPQWLELRNTIEQHLELLARQLSEHRVVVDVPAAPAYLDPELLRHVVTNLVSNAAKFSPTGTTITVRGRLEPRTIELMVSDEGIGIPPENQEGIFELFAQSSQSETAARGTGVGLAIVQRYVDLVDGEIVLDSAPGRGSTFTIRLPTRADEPRA